jgi:hypothetical protein
LNQPAAPATIEPATNNSVSFPHAELPVRSTDYALS